MICETCNNQHDGMYGTGRFCCSKCAKIFSSKSKTKETYVKISSKLKGTSYCSKGKIFEKENISIVCKICGNTFTKFVSFQYVKKVKAICEKCSGKTILSNPDKSLDPRVRAGRNATKVRLEKMKNLSWDEAPIPEKRRRVMLEQDNKCLCGIDQWLGKEIKLQLDHEDGNIKNYNRGNLRFLCPNCHSQTETFMSKNIKRKYPDYHGRKVSDEELSLALKETKNINQALVKVGLPNGGNYDRAKKLKLLLNLGE